MKNRSPITAATHCEFGLYQRHRFDGDDRCIRCGVHRGAVNYEILDRQPTAEELRAIRRLRNLARTWPQTLRLFSRSGTLEVQWNDPWVAPNEASSIEDIDHIPNDGGDT